VTTPFPFRVCFVNTVYQTVSGVVTSNFYGVWGIIRIREECKFIYLKPKSMPLYPNFASGIYSRALYGYTETIWSLNGGQPTPFPMGRSGTLTASYYVDGIGVALHHFLYGSGQIISQIYQVDIKGIEGKIAGTIPMRRPNTPQACV
jgi:hypothetical protein